MGAALQTDRQALKELKNSLEDAKTNLMKAKETNAEVELEYGACREALRFEEQQHAETEKTLGRKLIEDEQRRLQLVSECRAKDSRIAELEDMLEAKQRRANPTGKRRRRGSKP